jgi:O-antigen/teichoic acid export membrane protein
MNQPIKTKILSGVLWTFFMRWSIKLIGLVNTVILARLLTPDDFGIVAIAALVITFIDELSTINVSLLVIRKKNPVPEFDNTAWTVGILQSCFVALALYLVAPFAADFFHEPRIKDVIIILALVKVIVSFRNIGLFVALRDLNFALDFRFLVTARIVTFISIISFAVVLKSYWAIVYGMVIAEIINVGISYVMHSYRPWFSTYSFKECVKFATNMIPYACAQFLNNKIDVFVVGRFAATSTLGLYNVASELVSIFTKEIVLSASRGLFPNFSALSGDPVRFKSVYTQVLNVAITLCIPICFGFWAIIDDLVIVLLGEQWTESLKFMRWLIIYGGFSSITALMSEHAFIAIGLEKQANILMWIRLAIIIVCVLVFHHFMDIEGVAIGMAVSGVISFFIISIYVAQKLQLELLGIVLSFLRPFIAAFVMLAVIQYIDTFFVSSFPIVRLFIDILVGAYCFVIMLMILWLIQGRPKGIEEILNARLKI